MDSVRWKRNEEFLAIAATWAKEVKIWNRRKDPPEHFADFHHHQRRLDSMAAAQRRVNEELLAYIKADMAAPWMPAAQRLCDALDEALKVLEE